MASLIVLGLAQLASAQFSVAVSAGSASTNELVPTGTLVHVWANPYPESGGFDRWVGDAGRLSNSYGAHTTFVMPASNVAVTACFKTGQLWNAVSEVISNVQFTYYFPSGPIGVITFYHGTGGSGADWFADVENNRLVDDAVVNGYAAVACDSADRTNKQWDSFALLATNVDMLNMRGALELFQGRGWMSSNTPVFAVGMSDGGGFAPLISDQLAFRATAVFCASGIERVFKVTTVPTTWALAENDADKIPGAMTNYERLVSRGIPAQFYVNATSPVYRLRFWRIPGATSNDSIAVYQSFKTNGVLNGSDYLVQSPTNTAWTNYVPSYMRGYTLRIGDQLYVCNAEHKFYSDRNDQVLKFFGAFRPSSTNGVLLRDFRQLPDSSFQFTVPAEPGRPYRTQALSDLTATNWVTLSTNPMAGGTFDFRDGAASSHTTRFYRVLTP
jgi:hypothetical protein